MKCLASLDAVGAAITEIDGIINDLTRKAQENPRRRASRTGLQDILKLGSTGLNLSVVLPSIPGSLQYVRPHRHPIGDEWWIVQRMDPGISSTGILLDESGRVVDRLQVAEGGMYVAPAGIWHTLLVELVGNSNPTPRIVLMELYGAKYSPATYKEFHPTAPEEGSLGVSDFLKNIGAKIF